MDSGTITEYTGSETDITIPTTIAGYPVKAIGKRVFYYNKTIVSVTINSNVENIGASAFIGTENLKNLTINADNLVFSGSGSIDGAFRGSGLENVSINYTGSIKLNDRMFSRCNNLKSITLPNGIENLPQSIFERTENLETVILPNTLKTIEHGAFEDCHSLKTITISDSVNSLDSTVFENCTLLENVNIHDSVS
ncbi:MAG: leucine-rich repeat domain-containing protein [Eubacterium sp.]|nr:leucine-rich repeat domain-containing protein [Eubacterium sp.]